MHRMLGLLITCAALALPTPVEASEVLAHERYALDNGLDVILHVDRSLPLIAVDLTYHVGSGHDGARPGLAHLTEHLMFRGTRDVGDGMHEALIGDAGGHDNASTFFARTSYYAVLPGNQLPLSLWLESNRMAVMLPALDKIKVGEEVQTTIDEWRYRISSQRSGSETMELAAELYPLGHPWTPASPDEIERLTIDDVREFVRRYHGPQNATLVLAGDLPDGVRDQVERYFGHREGGERPTLPEFTARAASGERRFERRSEFATNPTIRLHWPSPALFRAGDAEADVAARIFEARCWALADDLVPGEVLWIHARQASDIGQSEFFIVIEGATSTTPARLLELVDQTLAQMHEQPATNDELVRARRSIRLGTLSGLESLENRAARMQIYVGDGKSPDWLDEDLARYDAVTSETVAGLLEQTLAPERRAVLLADPAKDAP